MKIYFTGHFAQQLKKLLKKYPHADEDLLHILEKLDPGKEISIGKSIYKIRIASRDLQKGKSAGFRTYVYLYRRKDLLVPLCIYAKTEQVSISENELQYHVNKMNEELLMGT